MKLVIQPILRPLDLGDYDTSLQGQILQVWVNPPLDVLNELGALNDEFGKRSTLVIYPEKSDRRDPKTRQADFENWFNSVFLRQTNTWYSRILSQGLEDTRWTVDELDTLYQASPGLLKWIKEMTMQLINEQSTVKKKS